MISLRISDSKMASILATGQYAYSGSINNGEIVNGPVPVTVDTLSCGDIQNALATFHAATDDYPVECDFVTLSGTGVVFFQDSVTMLMDNSTEVSIPASGGGFDEAFVERFYTMEL